MTYDVAAVRSQYPALAGGEAFFDGPGGTQVPRPVVDAVAGTLGSPVSNRSPHTAPQRAADEIVHACRTALGDLLAADPRGIVFGRSMTALTYDLSRAIAQAWGPGDEVVVRRLDHDGNVRPWVQAAEPGRHRALDRLRPRDRRAGHRRPGGGAERPHPAGGGDGGVQRPRHDARRRRARGAGPRRRRAGVRRRCALHRPRGGRRRCPRRGLLRVLAVQVRRPALRCVVAAAPALLEELRPDKLVPSTDVVPERFELGTLPYELMAGTTAAIDFLASLDPAGAAVAGERVVGAWDAIGAHEDVLRDRIEHALLERPDVTLWSRAERRTSTLYFSVDGQEPATSTPSSGERGISVSSGHCYAWEPCQRLGLGPTGAVRVGLAPYTDDEDVHRLLEARPHPADPD